MFPDSEKLSREVFDQVTIGADTTRLFIPRSVAEQQASADKTKAETDLIREQIWKIKWKRRVFEGVLPGFVLGIIVCLAFIYWR